MTAKVYEHKAVPLSGAELAEYIHKVLPRQMTDSEVAKKVGRTQPYVSKLRRIREEVPSALRQQWRNEQIPVSVMYAVSRLPKNRQHDELQKLQAAPRLRRAWPRRKKKPARAAGRTTTVRLTAADDALLRALHKATGMRTQTDILRCALLLLAERKGVSIPKGSRR